MTFSELLRLGGYRTRDSLIVKVLAEKSAQLNRSVAEFWSNWAEPCELLVSVPNSRLVFIVQRDELLRVALGAGTEYRQIDLSKQSGQQRLELFQAILPWASTSQDEMEFTYRALPSHLHAPTSLFASPEQHETVKPRDVPSASELIWDYTINGEILRIPVRVVQERQHFGRVDYLVEPLGGSGTRWVKATKVSPALESPGRG